MKHIYMLAISLMIFSCSTSVKKDLSSPENALATFKGAIEIWDTKLIKESMVLQLSPGFLERKKEELMKLYDGATCKIVHTSGKSATFIIKREFDGTKYTGGTIYKQENGDWKILTYKQGVKFE